MPILVKVQTPSSSRSPSSHYLMGPPPPSSPPALSADWFLTAIADPDTRILSQALTHELRAPAARETLEPGSARPDSLHLHKALEQQQQHGAQQQRQVGLAIMSRSRRRQEGFSLRENCSLQWASPPSSSSPPASNSGSPLSTMTAAHSSLSIPKDGLLPHMQSITRSEAMGLNFLRNPQSPTEPFPPSSSYSQSSRRAAMALSARATCGKAGRRRSRAASRSQITVLSADVANFRAMVQHLTGIPSPSFMQFYENSSLLKPQPVMNSCAVTMNLPTLDTSAALLKSKPPVKDPLNCFSFTRKYHDQGSDDFSIVSADVADANGGNSLHGQQCLLSDRSKFSSSLPTLSRLSSPFLSSIWDHTDNGKLEGNSSCFAEGQQFSTKQAMTGLDELAPMMAHYNAVDSCLVFDGVISDQFPQSEIARMA